MRGVGQNRVMRSNLSSLVQLEKSLQSDVSVFIHLVTLSSVFVLFLFFICYEGEHDSLSFTDV